jgi:osmoprotectant transport system permease protein
MSPPGDAVLAYASASNPWFSWAYVRQNSAEVFAALREHTTLTATSVLIAALIAIPLAVLAYWFPRLAGPILALSGFLYTVPALALFALLAPFVGIGSSTVVIGLVVYALLVIVRNAIAGLTQVPADVRDAARGMGYGRLAVLLRVELPLALPAILTGVRLATVSTVALVTIGVLLGHGGFGQPMTAGFRSGYRAEIMMNVLFCVGLALVLDLFWIVVGRLVTPWQRRSSR